jgi:hypothetical protein
MTPQAIVLSNTRFVDNGHIVTTAGVSAGIDGALHVVSRIKGQDVAMATARYMEYDKWLPDAGRIIESPFVRAVREQGLQYALTNAESKSDVQPPYYFGEMRNLAHELIQSDAAESAVIFEWLMKRTKPGPALFDGLGLAWRKLGKESPVSSTMFLDKLTSGEIEWARHTWTTTIDRFPAWQLATEADVNLAGYRLLQRGETQNALDVFLWNTQLHPESANAWDSLADGYENAGDPENALQASNTCLTILKRSEVPVPQAGALEKASIERIARLDGK